MRPTVKILDIETNEEIEREMNDVEFEQYQKDQADIAKARAKAQAAIEAKAALLERLGITEEEAKLLLG